MGEPVKGTVMPISSLFPVDEAHKALQRVHDTIVERQKHMDQLNDFVADNKSLIDLVQRLPEKLHHDIMVPFGKAAFFPGRLIHTNEFMVLLGEGYYADRSSKQTIEILTRRGKALESQVQNLKAVMQDLDAEATFFDTTASESAEGLVEIREDITEETSYGESAASGVPIIDSCSSSKADDAKQKIGDEEYARILSRIAELEKEEEEANETSDDEPGETDSDTSIHQPAMDQPIGSPEVHGLNNLTKAVRSSRTESNEVRVAASRNHDQLQVEAPNVQALPKDDYLQGECLPFCQPRSTEVAPRPPVLNDNSKDPLVLESKAVVNTAAEERFDASKAFTGCIVEHAPNTYMKPREQIVGRTSKPVSRFKMWMK